MQIIQIIKTKLKAFKRVFKKKKNKLSQVPHSRTSLQALIQYIKSQKNIHLLIGSTIFLILLIPLVILISKKPASTLAWWNNSWRYRKSVPITNSGTAQTDFQIAVTLDTSSLISAGKMQSDCDDIRLTDSDGTLLPHWIDESTSCNTSSTKIWTKVPSIPTAGETLYLYYGNQYADNAENGTNVFEFFDDFTGASFQSDWNQDSGTWAVETFDSKSTASIEPAAGYNYLRYTNYNTSSSFTIESHTYSTQSGDTSAHPGIMFYSASGYNDHFYFRPHSYNLSNNIQYAYWNGSLTTPEDFTGIYNWNTWMNITIKVNGDSAQVFQNGTSKGTRTGLQYDGTYSNVGLASHSSGKNYWAYIAVRKYASTEPSVGTLGPEKKFSSPVAYWKFDEGYGTDINDSTENENNGTFSGSTWQDKSMCISENCLFLDTNSVTVLDTNDTLDLADNMSFSFWWRPQTQHTDYSHRLLQKQTNTSDSNLALYFFGTNGGSSPANEGLIRVYANRGSVWGSISGSYYVTDSDLGKWMHIAFSYDSSTGGQLYINGQPQGSLTGSGALATNDASLTINTGLADMYIDELKFYDYTRTADQVKTDYLSQNTPEGSSAYFGPDYSYLSDGLIGYWKLDESSGNTSDDSGNGLDLTNVNTTSYVTAKYGNGADYESGSSQYHYIADNEELSITGDLTLSAWIKPESVTASTLFNITGKWDGSNESYLLSQYGDEIRLYIDSSSNYVTTDSTNLSTGTWYHVTTTYNSTKQTVNIFVNGELQDSTTTGTIPSSIGDDAGRFHIATEDSTTTATNFYDGVIDNVMLHKTVLSPTQIQQLYEWAPGPIGYWKLDDKTTTSTVKDYTSYDNDLTNYYDKTNGIDYGYKTTNLTFYANQWDGGSNTGEIYITGTTLTDKDDGSRTVTPLNNGIALVENLGTAINGYIMWSSESVHTRFSANAPHADNADHFIGVFHDGTNWKYDNNTSSYTFTPVSTDLIVADITFGTTSGVDSITPVPTSSTNVEQASWNDGVFGTGLNLSDTFLSATDPSDFDFTSTEKFTLETWAKTSGASSNMYLIDKKDATNGGYKLYQDSSGNYCFDIDDDSTWSPDDSTCTSGADYGDDEWHHITAIKDGTSSISIYIDGVYANSDTSIATTGTLVNTGDFRIGVSWIGILDDIKIYNYIRTPKQITEDLNAGHPIGGSPLSSMVGHWKFDEGYGSEVNNSGYPPATNGTATGGTITYSEGWKIHTFTTSNDGTGVFNVSSSIQDAKVLVVAGGGGGGEQGGGGGGGGEVETYTGVSISAGAKNITVGGGGAGSTGSRGTNGGNSSALGYTAVGGGGGGDYDGGAGTETGKDGGSGGGGASSHIITTLGGSGTASGGDGKGNGGWKSSPFPAGGAGGAGHDGYTPTAPDKAGNGGAGKSSDISGSTVYYGGGGGGAIYGYGTPGTGGIGGGGDGGRTLVYPEDGTDNLGGGGGGGGNGHSGGDGGSGTIIISYPDSSNGTITGADWTNDGKLNKALDFVSETDRVDFNTDYSEITDELTISAWVQTHAAPNGDGRIVASTYDWDATAANIRGWTLGNDDGSTDSIYMRIFDNSGNSAIATQTNFHTNNLNTWAHVAGVFKSSEYVKLYVNGNLVAEDTSSVPSAIAYNGTNDLRIGGRSDTTTTGEWDGLIDEVKLYSAALTPDQILIDMNQGKSVVMGSLSTTSDGTTPDNSSTREYCMPGETSTCTAPIAEWKFDENTGTSAYDTSENEYTGTITSATWTNGKVGQALNFDGSNDWVSLGNLGNPGSGTISFWFKKSNINAGAQYLLDGRDTGNWWLLQDYVSGSCTDASGNVCFNSLVEIPSTLLANDTWEHVVVTSNSTESKIYLNGKLIDTGTGLAIDFRSVRVGTRYTNSAYLNGQIDELRIYDYVQTPNQIAWQYNRGKPIGWWKLDECQNSTLYDSSDSGNNGTITIGALGTQTSVGTCTTSGAWYNGATGKQNSSLNFDGTDDYASVSNDAALNFGSNSFSVSYWLNFNSGSSQQRWSLGKGNPYLSSAAAWAIANWTTGDPVTPVLYVSDGTGGANHTANFKSMYRGSWHQLTFVIDRDSDLAKTYFDGVYTDQLDISAIGSFDNTSNLLIGAGATAGNCSDVKIDDVRLYNYTLTNQQIKTLYNLNSIVNFSL